MEWTRSDTVALAMNSCSRCGGLGYRLARKRLTPCHCVLRAIFRQCYARFRVCATQELHTSRISLGFALGRGRTQNWGRKDEEYMADFVLVSRRTLTESDYRIFASHFLLGADWKLCCRKLKMDRGSFFHAVYRIERELGRVFRELEPYGLFPVDEYFQGPIRSMKATAFAALRSAAG